MTSHHLYNNPNILFSPSLFIRGGGNRNKTNMDRFQKTIIAYLTKNLGKRTFIYDTSLFDDESTEIYGMNAIKILVSQNGNIVRYKIMASK